MKEMKEMFTIQQLVKDQYLSTISNRINGNDLSKRVKSYMGSKKYKFSKLVKESDYAEVQDNGYIRLTRQDILDSVQDLSRGKLVVSEVVRDDSCLDGVELLYSDTIDDVSKLVNEDELYIDIEGEIELIQIYCPKSKVVCIIDVARIMIAYSRNDYTDYFCKLFKSDAKKYFFDCRGDISTIIKCIGVSLSEITHVLDLQSNERTSLLSMLHQYQLDHPLKGKVSQYMKQSRRVWSYRPVHRDLLRYAMMDVVLLYRMHQMMEPIDYTLLERKTMESLMKHRDVAIDTADITSSCDSTAIDDLLGIRLNYEGVSNILIELSHDIRYSRQGTYELINDSVVTHDTIDRIMEVVKDQRCTSNRVIFGETLHRLSKRYDVNGDVIGFTIRVGQRISGLECVVKGLIENKNALICGPPNVGKTTLLRSICSYMSINTNLCLIDTSGEVCGDVRQSGKVVGRSRVFQFKSSSDQYNVLLDCVKNHSPDYIVIDELHTRKEVNLCHDTISKSVRVIASVHGDVKDLMRSSELNKLTGGLTSVIMSDKNLVDGSKVVTEMTTKPSFDVIINIRKVGEGSFKYVFIDNLSNNIKKMLDNKPIQVTSRTIRDGNVFEKMEYL